MIFSIFVKVFSCFDTAMVVVEFSMQKHARVGISIDSARHRLGYPAHIAVRRLILLGNKDGGRPEIRPLHKTACRFYSCIFFRL